MLRAAPIAVLVGCTSAGPPAGPPAPASAWLELRGAGACVHRMSRDPAALAPALAWESGCPDDQIPGCERLVIPDRPEGELVLFSEADAVHDAVLRVALEAREESRTDALYAEDGRPLLALRTRIDASMCPLQFGLSPEGAALLSSDQARPDVVDAVVFAGPTHATSAWAAPEVVFTGVDMLSGVRLGVLPHGRAALFQPDEPQVIVTEGEGRWRAAERLQSPLLDGVVVGEHLVLQTATDELRLVSLAPGGSQSRAYAPSDRELGALRTNGADEFYWLELPAFEASPARTSPEVVTVEVRAARIPPSGAPISPRTLARFPDIRYSDFFAGKRPLHTSFHASPLPHLGIGPGGLYVHIGRAAEDLLLLVRPADARAWGWAVGKGRRTPGLGAELLAPAPGDERPHVDEFRSILFVGEDWLALKIDLGVDRFDVRRYPLAAFQVPEAELR